MPYTDVVSRTLRVPDAGGGIRKLLVGQLVDADDLNDADNLRERGFIAPIEPDIEPAQATDGTWYAARSYLTTYRLRQHRPVPRPDLRFRQEADKEGFPRHLGRGTYELSSGERVKGKAKARDAEDALNEEPQDTEESDGEV